MLLNSFKAASRIALQAQLTTTTTSQSSASQELSTLRKKVEDVEREKRDLLGVISRLEEDVAQREQEVLQLRDAVKDARKDVQELESTVRDTRASERSINVRPPTNIVSGHISLHFQFSSKSRL